MNENKNIHVTRVRAEYDFMYRDIITESSRSFCYHKDTRKTRRCVYELFRFFQTARCESGR